MHSLLGNYREVANPDKLDLSKVDRDELARVRHICDEILTVFRTNADVKILGINTNLQTKLSVQGWNDHISMVDWCNKFHNTEDPKFATITDSIVNPITGEINMFINKESANAARRAKQGKIKTHATTAAIGGSGKIALFCDDDDNEHMIVKTEPKRRPYIPKK